LIVFAGMSWRQFLTSQVRDQGCSEKEIAALLEQEKEKGINMSDEITRLRERVSELEIASKYLLEAIEPPPDPQCNCHISPPCHDCVEFSELREAIAEMEYVLFTGEKP